MATQQSSESTAPRGHYAKWRGEWYRVLWSGRTRDGYQMAKLHTLPEVWPDRAFWVKLSEIEATRKTKPPIKTAPAPTRLDRELSRRLARDD